MTIATQILGLRQNQSSSVKTLIAMLDWQKAAQDDSHILSRGFAVTQAVDHVLLNVAVHVAEALNEPPPILRARHAVSPSRRKRRLSSTQVARGASNLNLSSGFAL